MKKLYYQFPNLKYGILLSFLFLSFGTFAQTTRYVKQGGTGNGSSWAQASGDIQAMISTAAWGDPIWVAAGIYSPSSGLSYSLKNGIKLYGGFPATGTPVISDRNAAANTTILQANGNRIMLNSDVDFTAFMDGFTLQGAMLTAAGDNGGAILNSNSSPLISNCIFRNNSVVMWGGAIYNVGADTHAKFINCLFYGNSASGGGAIFDHNSATPVYTNCTITGNTSTQNGGGIHTYENAVATLNNCIVWNNDALSAGDEFYSISGTASVTANYSVIANDTNDISGTFNGTQIIYSDPLFATGTYTLLQCSPAINAGNNAYITGTTTDLANNARLYSSGTADIGAYEYQGAPGTSSAPTASAQIFCGSATVANLTATGTVLKWYTASTGGTALATSAALSTTTYYVSQTVGGCESLRTSVSVTINPLPAAPTASAQNFCGSATVTNLTASGTSLKWYNAFTGGTALATSTALSTTTYYVSQTNGNGCESTRTSVSVTVNVIPAAPTASSQVFCGSATVANLTATGSLLQWYAGSTGGSALAASTALTTTTYYVSQTVNGCESPRAAVNITVNTIPAAPAASAQNFCGSGNTVANLAATGTALQWYAASTGGTALSASTELATNTYYVSQTINGCEGPRTAVSVSVNPVPAMPVAATPQNFATGVTFAGVAATGANLQWYSSATAGTAMAPETQVQAGTYYVSQTVNGCESPRATVAVTIYYPIRYVRAVASGTGDGTSWANASSDLQGMINIANAEQVWVAAGTYQPALNQSFVMKEGIKIYGGFSASGTPAFNDRNWQANPTLLQGNGGRVIHNNNNGLTNAAVLDGFTIYQGTTNENGGGIKNVAAYPTIANCIFRNNTAGTWGGALHNQGNGSAKVINCVFYSNQSTGGGAAFDYSNAKTVYTNVTFANNNSTSNGGALHTYDNAMVKLYNCIFYGNTATGLGKQIESVAGSSVEARYCLIQDGASNVDGPITSTGVIAGNPAFINAAGGNFTMLPCSPAVNAGNNAFVSGIAKDLAGNTRIYAGTVDMGAYELQEAALIVTSPVAATPQNFEPGATVASLSATGSNLQWYTTAEGGTALASGTVLGSGTYYAGQSAGGCEPARTPVVVNVNYPDILYIKPVATGLGDGTSWDNASDNIQAMVNAPEVLQVWVAGGTYKPAVSANGSADDRTKAFVLKNNVKVYGGFAGIETALEQRDLATNITILSGDLGVENDASDNAYHIVISAGAVGTAELNGFTLTGANANNVSGMVVNGRNVANYMGAGMVSVYSSPLLNNVVISNNDGLSYGGMYNNNSSPVLNNVAINDNAMGGMYNESSNPTLTRVAVNGNGGNGINNYYSTPSYVSASINGNSGDGIYLSGNGSVTHNNLNISGNGGNGIHIENTNGGGSVFINVTISGNANYSIYNQSGWSVSIRNSIIYGNGNGLNDDNNSRVNSLVQGYTNTTSGNISAITNPAFTNAPACTTAPFTNGDYRLMACSPLINKGYNLYISGVATDPDGNPRVYNSGTVDMGSYEYQGTPTVVAVPAVQTQQEFEPGTPTVADLVATGSNVKWYRNEEGTTPLAADTPLSEGKYYVNQTIGSCESMLTEVVVVIHYPPIVYVKPVATGTGDGTSWANASADLQDMINGTGVEQVWVAAGTHKPTTKAGTGFTNRHKAFVMKNNVKVYGGFTGNETALEQRDWEANITTLSGDLGTENDASDNAFHIIISAGDVGSAVLDGFTLTKANGDIDADFTLNNQYIGTSYGNGIFCYQSSPTFANLIITGNFAGWAGAGMYDGESSPILSNVIISDNIAGEADGGGIYNDSYSSLQLTDVTISNNTGDGIVSYGSVSMDNVTISGNTRNGIYMYAYDEAITLTDVTISGNGADGIYNWYSSPLLTNVTISGNGNYGINNNSYQSMPVLKNTIVYGNRFGIAENNGSYTMYNNSLMQGVTDTSDGNLDGNTDPLFTNTPSYTNAPFTGGDYTLQQASPAIDAGNTDYFTDAATATDLAGNERLFGTAIDMGAYEFKPDDCGTVTTIWNGSAWSNGEPVSTIYSAVIEGNFNSAEDGEITACSLTVNDGDVVIAEGDNFNIKGVITVYDAIASLTVRHNANLIQVDDVENIGTITVIKESAPMYRLDYALWTSPVAWQNLKGFSSQTLDNRFYTYNPLSDAYATVASPVTTYMDKGKSYLIRVANNHPAYVSDAIAPTPWEGMFMGLPNNGNVDVPVTGMADGINGYNGIGNPYPSSINIKAFFEANQNNLAEDTPIYFWRKKNDAGTSSYCSLTLAGYNKNTGNAFGDSSNGVFDDPNDSENWVINPGQGFIVQAVGSTVTFNNEMRVAVNNGQMFRSAMDVTDKSRLWLNLTNSEGAFSQTTIAYTPFTTLGRDFSWDGKALTDGDIALYSIAGEDKFGIQARPAFDAADEVPMEYKVTLAGNYTISLDHFDGIFTEGQEIYLRDNVLGVTHNLDAPYEFTTESGIISGRFDVVYAEALDTDIPAFNSNSIIVYKQGSVININIGNIDIRSVAVYDIRGRLLYSANAINAAATSITTLQAQEQMLILEVTTVEGIKASRKIIF